MDLAWDDFIGVWLGIILLAWKNCLLFCCPTWIWLIGVWLGIILLVCVCAQGPVGQRGPVGPVDTTSDHSTSDWR